VNVTTRPGEAMQARLGFISRAPEPSPPPWAGSQQPHQESHTMAPTALSLHPAGHDDMAYIYRLCEATMRAYVEADLGDCFEAIARPTIQRLVQRGLFFKIHADGVLVGAVAAEQHETHLQLEELYIEAARQNQGLGTLLMGQFIDRARSLDLPIHLHVLSSNPARSFYERLGFSVTRSTPQVNHMAYRPRPESAPGPAGPGP